MVDVLVVVIYGSDIYLMSTEDCGDGLLGGNDMGGDGG